MHRRHAQHHNRPYKPGEPPRRDTGQFTSPFHGPDLKLPPLGDRQLIKLFKPINRRDWKDARRHCWFQLAGILGQLIEEIRQMKPAELRKRIKAGAAKTPDGAKNERRGFALVRRLDRLAACEPRPQEDK